MDDLNQETADTQTTVENQTVTVQSAINAGSSEKTVSVGTAPQLSKEAVRFKENFRFFGPVTTLYAIFYAFCMYRNGSGITYPFFLAGSLFYFYFSMEKLGLTLKRGSGFYMVSMMLLAISTFCTDDSRIIFFNKTGIFLLTISLLLKQFCNTEKWGLGKYLLTILTVTCTSFVEFCRPVSDGIEYLKKHQNSEKKNVFYILVGLLITLPIFVIVLLLLSSADAVFRQVADSLLGDMHFGNVVMIALRILFWYFAVYMLFANLCNKNIKDEVKDFRTGEPILAITVTSMLSLLYLVFSGIQIIYLFLGKMQLPEGYTYAEYAREGFFQLLAVSIINLIIVLVCLSFFRSSKVLRVVLTVMSLCTFIMIASSALRMMIYIRYYYLTFLRILVLWALAVLAFLFAGVMINIYRETFGLFRYSMTIVSVFYILLSFSHPDYWIAEINLSNAPNYMASAKAFYEQGKKNGQYDWIVGQDNFFQCELPYQDYSYLSGLSADAAPALIPYLKKLGFDLSVFDIKAGKPEAGETEDEWYDRSESRYWDAVALHYPGEGRVRENRPEGFGYYYLWRLRNTTEKMGLRSFNLSRYLAMKQVEKCK